jgi:hypothetical protein
VKELVLQNRRITINEVANTPGISFTSVQSILKDNFDPCQTVTKFVPCLLSEEQRENCVKMCHDVQEELERNPELLLKIITVMRCVFMGMDQKPTNSCLCGRAHHLHTQNGKTS